MRKLTWLVIVAVMLLSVLWEISGTALGESTYKIPKNLKKLSPAEKWVVEMVQEGEVADLKDEFGDDESSRILRAQFLEALLTDKFKNLSLHRKGVHINNAIIKDSLNLNNASVKHLVHMDYCVFKDDINLMDSIFENNLFLINCTFEKKANFHRIKIMKNAHFNRSTFAGPVDFAYADIGGGFRAEKANFNEKDEGVVFNSVIVGSIVDLRETTFNGPVNFIAAHIKSQFRAEKAKFLKEGEKDVNEFSKMRVEGSAYFEENIFNSEICLNDSYFLDLIIKGNCNKNIITSIMLNRTVIKRKLIIENAKVDKLYARYLSCNHAILEKNNIESLLDLRHSNFQILNLIENSWPEKRYISSNELCKENGTWLDGLTYQYIDALKGPGCSEEDKCKAFLLLIKKSYFNLRPLQKG